MRRMTKLLLLVLLTFALVLPASAAPEIVIRAAHNQTSMESTYTIGMNAFKEKLEEISGGLIGVEVYHGSLSQDEAELIEKVQLGDLQIAVASPGFMTALGVKEVDLLALPYIFDSYEHWTKVVDGDIGAEIAKMINEKSGNDFRILGFWSAGVRHYYGKKPINSVEDLKGINIRTQTSGTVAKYWQSLGVTPINVAWGELYQALEQGQADSAENAYPFFVQMSHHRAANGKYISETGHDYTSRFFLVNGHYYDTLTEQQKAWLNEAVAYAAKVERDALYEQEDQYKQIAIADGAVVNELDRTPLMEAAIPIQDEFAASIDATDLLERIRNAK